MWAIAPSLVGIFQLPASSAAASSSAAGAGLDRCCPDSGLVASVAADVDSAGVDSVDAYSDPYSDWDFVAD